MATYGLSEPPMDDYRNSYSETKPYEENGQIFSPTAAYGCLYPPMAAYEPITREIIRACSGGVCAMHFFAHFCAFSLVWSFGVEHVFSAFF